MCDWLASQEHALIASILVTLDDSRRGCAFEIAQMDSGVEIVHHAPGFDRTDAGTRELVYWVRRLHG